MEVGVRSKIVTFLNFFCRKDYTLLQSVNSSKDRVVISNLDIRCSIERRRNCSNAIQGTITGPRAGRFERVRCPSSATYGSASSKFSS